MLKHNDRSTGLDYMEATFSYLALQRWYDIDSAKVFNLLSTANQCWSTCRAHHLHLQHCQDEPWFRPGSPQVHYSWETHVCGVCRSIKLTSLRDASEHIAIPSFGQLFCAPIKDDWGHQGCELLLIYDQNVLHDSLFISHQNGMSYYSQLFHCSTSVERVGLNCKVEYTDANPEILPGSHNIWDQYMECDLGETFLGRVPSSPIIYFRCTPANHILQFPDHLPSGKTILIFSNRCEKRQQWILCPQVHEYALLIPPTYKDLHHWAECVERFILVVKQTNIVHIVPGGAIVGPAHLVQGNAASARIDSIWLVDNLADLDTYGTVY